MAQLHCYVPDSVAVQIKHKAEQSHLSVSKYLSQLVKRDVSTDQWPEGYAELFEQWQGDPPQRGPQGDYEERLAIE